MIEAAKPPNEIERLAALRSFAILDTDPEESFDEIARLASYICGTPIALVSLVDEERQWFKSRIGLDAAETPRSVAFCAHAIQEPSQVLVVQNAHGDRRFADNPLVTGAPHVCFYAGAPLVEKSGQAVGTLCVIDHHPREISAEKIEALRVLAHQVTTQLELRKKGIELRALAEELVHANQDLDEFARFAAHDLQQPLNNIIALGDLLRTDEEVELSPDTDENIRLMTESSWRMHQLIRDLLVLSRAGRGEMHHDEVSLRSCVDDALGALDSELRARHVDIRIEELPPVRGDRTLLTQLFQNLIGNGIKFVAPGTTPRIQITCARDGDQTVFGVRDNGIGIPAESVEKIFAPFQRLHPQRDYDGTGVGLSIVRKVVERHGGRIWVESEPGRGSHFRFVLGTAPAAAPAAETAATGA